MSSNQRYRTGNIAEVRGVVPAATLAEIGDLVCLDANVVKPFSAFAGTSTTFRAQFLGVLQQGAAAAAATATSPCLVYVDGEFEFPLSATAAAVVDVGGLVKATANQVVATGAAIVDAIGRLCRPVAVGDTTAFVWIESVIARGGPQGVVIA